VSSAPDPRSRLAGFAGRLEAFASSEACAAGCALGETLRERAQRFGETSRADRDGISTQLMEVYKQTGSKEAFTLLYELNHEDFLRLIYHHLRRAFYPVDPGDVLQEVFFNVYRYPFKFKPDRNSAFRNWTHSIIRNTVLKHSRRAQRDRFLSFGVRDKDTDEGLLVEPADDRVPTPFEAASRQEDTESLVEAWTLYLHFYLQAYRCLTPREKRVLHLVEVEGLPYREGANLLNVRVENLKMMVFRARRKIFSIMKRKFQMAQNECVRRDLASVSVHQEAGA